MARRIEIAVPVEYADVVREVLENPYKCDLGENSAKPGTIVEVEAKETMIFVVTIPSGAVSGLVSSSNQAAIISTRLSRSPSGQWSRYSCRDGGVIEYGRLQAAV